MTAVATDFKQKIIEELDVLRKFEVQQKNVFKARAYVKAIQSLQAHIGPIVQADDIKGIEGIGEKTRVKIIEIIQTGHLQRADVIREDTGVNAREELLKVYGIGPAKANELVEMGIKTIDALKNAVKANPELLHDKQKIGLLYVDDINLRIPRDEMLKHEKRIQKMVTETDPRFHMQVVGSYRRKAENSGDIDVLLTMPPEVSLEQGTVAFGQLVQNMLKKRRGTGAYLIETLAIGDKKCMGICKLNTKEGTKARRLDLLFLPAEEYAYGVLYFTGSGPFNIGMRRYALDKGYTLNEHRLKPVRDGVEEPPLMSTEEDIFRFLGLQYITPQKRETANDAQPV